MSDDKLHLQMQPDEVLTIIKQSREPLEISMNLHHFLQTYPSIKIILGDFEVLVRRLNSNSESTSSGTPSGGIPQTPGS